MKITSVDMYNSSGSVIANLSFRDPGARNPYIAKAIFGLDADEIVARFYGLSNLSNSKYYNFSLEKRDVVLRIQLNPQFSSQSYSELRDELYKSISSSRTGRVELRFNESDVSIAHVFGFIKKFESALFSDTPEVQITIECDDPMLRGLDRIKPLVARNLSTARILDDLSTAPHGFIFDVTFSADSPSFIIRDSSTPEWAFTVTPPGGFLFGDNLFYSSEYANKYLYMIRGGVTTHLVDKIQANSVWPILFPGENYFDSSDEQFTWNNVSYLPAFWGV